MCDPLMCNIAPLCNIFLSNLCFAPCPLCATVKKNFNSKMTKMNGNGLNMVFKVIKLTSKAMLRAMSPMCNTFLGSLSVAHWVYPVYMRFNKFH